MVHLIFPSLFVRIGNWNIAIALTQMKFSMCQMQTFRFRFHWRHWWNVSTLYALEAHSTLQMELENSRRFAEWRICRITRNNRWLDATFTAQRGKYICSINVTRFDVNRNCVKKLVTHEHKLFAPPNNNHFLLLLLCMVSSRLFLGDCMPL